MAFDFPNSPSLNQQVTQGSITYTWNGVSWIAGASGFMNVSSGGTGRTDITLGNLVVGNGANSLILIAPGTSGNVLLSNGNYWYSSTISSDPSAAYNQANTATTIGSAAYGQANTARDNSNTNATNITSAYGQANTARDNSNTAVTNAGNAYGQANTARDNSNTNATNITSAFGQANTALTTGQAAFAQANASQYTANAFGNVMVTGTDSGYNWTIAGNSGIDSTSTAASKRLKIVSGSGIEIDMDTGNNAIRFVTGAFSKANTAGTDATNAFGTANTASTNAINAYGQANTATTNAGNAYGQANTATTNAGNAFGQANTARDNSNTNSTNITSAFAKANTAGTDATNAYGQANTALTTGQAAFAYANGRSANTGTMNFIIDGGGSAITGGAKGDVEFSFPAIITSWDLFLDQTGSLVVNIWKASYNNYPPVLANAITSATPPTVSSGVKANNSTLSGWTTSISAGEILRMNVDSAATATRATLVLKYKRTD